MRALQASTSYSVVFGISPAAPLLRPSRHRHVILAQVEPSEKSVEIMRKFSEQYAGRSGTFFCVDKGVTSVVIKREALGVPVWTPKEKMPREREELSKPFLAASKGIKMPKLLSNDSDVQVLYI